MALILRVLLVLLFPLAALASQDVTGRRLPKIEVGMAFLGFHLTDYPGADESRTRAFPAPYVIYRGEVFRADREGGYRGRFLKWERFEFDISASASFPANAADNKARQGMQDLDWLGEFGPRLKYKVVRTPIIKLDLELPIRFVFSTDGKHSNSRGYTASPELSFQHRALFDKKSYFNASIFGIWTTEKLMDYFYEVDPADARADRPIYDAQSGFLGYSVRASYVRPLFDDRWFIFAGLGKSFFADAKNRSSPLMRDIETESYFVGLAWNFYFSDEKEVMD